MNPPKKTSARTSRARAQQTLLVTKQGEPAPNNLATTFIDSNFDYAAFVVSLAGWFAGAQRDLPWRHAVNARDPYRVVVSEFMLQQTTVAAVVPFYHRFLARFPTVETLGEASLEDVLPFWAGLGYYQRARNLHALARAVAERHGGVFPRELDDVLALPGVGRYTAGAVTSIAFDAPSPIVDANVARVFSRIFLVEGDLKGKAATERLWHEATSVVNACSEEHKPSVVNPALMELGALVCTPRSPRCDACPVSAFCGAFATGRQNELPFIAPKRAPVDLFDACVFIQSTAEFEADEPRVLLRQRPHDAKVWWRGMWELPRITAHEDESTAEAATRLLRDELGLGEVKAGSLLKTVRHGVTHHRITLDCYGVDVDIEPVTEPRGAQWFSWDEIEHLALPAAMKSLLRWLRRHPEGEKPEAQT
ncbi:MAG TPA: A/G-specific adenine glycosylase, partial [Abditibacteriaceae bacterium]